VEKEKEKQPGNKFLDSLDSSLISLLRCFIRFSQLSRRAADSEVSKTRRDHYEKHFCLHLFPHVLHHPPNCLAHTHRPPPLTTLSLSLFCCCSHPSQETFHSDFWVRGSLQSMSEDWKVTFLSAGIYTCIWIIWCSSFFVSHQIFIPGFVGISPEGFLWIRNQNSESRFVGEHARCGSDFSWREFSGYIYNCMISLWTFSSFCLCLLLLFFFSWIFDSVICPLRFLYGFPLK
jgi:hypothetical protein